MGIALLAALVLSAKPALPRYIPLELYQLVATAERVVSGSIVALDEQTFYLAVERDLLGGDGAKTMRVTRFVDWTCASRWAPYRVGQRVLLFLRDGRAMGAGDEGDWPLVEGRALAPYRIHGIEYAPLSIEGRTKRWTPVAIDELQRAIAGYRSCFGASYERIEGRDKLCLDYAYDESAAFAFARSSKLAWHLYEQTISSKAFRKLAGGFIPAPSLETSPAIRACADGYCARPTGPGRLRDCEFGTAMASVGDINGDGWGDLAIQGDPLELWIVLLDGTARVLSRKKIEPRGFGDVYFAHSLAGIGDFDGDGIGDLAVGAPAKNKNDAGRVFVLALERDGSLKRALPLSMDSLESFQAKPGLGSTLVSMGPGVDGYLELLVDSDPMFAGIDFGFAADVPPSAPSPPRTHTLTRLRADGSGEVQLATVLTAEEFIGDDSDVTFADALCTLGDLDRDGISEVAIGYRYDSDGGDDRGAVWIAFFERDGSLRAKTKISDWSGGFEGLLLDGDELGCELAAPGDLDGNGVPDLVVGGARELWILLLRCDGTAERCVPFGQRLGGFVPFQQIRSLAVLRGPENRRRLAIGGVREGEPAGRRTGAPDEAVLWVLNLGPGPTLSAP